MKTYQAKRRVTTTIAEKEIIICKGDYILGKGTVGEDVTLSLGNTDFTKTAASFEDLDLELPNYFGRLGISNLQKVIPVCLLAKSKGFRFEDKEIGRPLRKEEKFIEEDILDTFSEYFENPEKKICLVYSHQMRSLKPDSIVHKNGKPMVGVSNRFQAILVDFSTEKDEEFVKAFTIVLDELKVLSEPEKKRILYTKLADKWNAQLKERKTKLVKEIKEFTKQTEDYQAQLIQAHKNIRNAFRDSEHVNKLLSQDAEEIVTKIKEVEELPFVTDTSFKDTTFIVKIADVVSDFVCDGNTYSVPFKGVRFELTPTRVDIFHDTPVKQSDRTYYHPHIVGPDNEEQNQFACFGDQKTKIANLLAERRFKEVVFMAKVLLGSHNEGDTLLNLREYLVARGFAKFESKGIVPLKPKETQTNLVTADDI